MLKRIPTEEEEEPEGRRSKRMQYYHYHLMFLKLVQQQISLSLSRAVSLYSRDKLFNFHFAELEPFVRTSVNIPLKSVVS